MSKKSFLLVLRDHEDRWVRFSPDELQATLEKFAAWNADLRAAEAFAGAGKLSPDLGTTIRRVDGDLVVDGPFSEAKEAIAGYYIVSVADRATAETLAGKCPILTYGGSVEVREMLGTIAP